jgi:hypothetical protein
VMPTDATVISSSQPQMRRERPNIRNKTEVLIIRNKTEVVNRCDGACLYRRSVCQRSRLFHNATALRHGRGKAAAAGPLSRHGRGKAARER